MTNEVNYAAYRNSDGSLNHDVINKAIALFILYTLGIAAAFALLFGDDTPSTKTVSDADASAIRVNVDCHNNFKDGEICLVEFTDPVSGCEYFITNGFRATPTLTPRIGGTCFTDQQEPLLQPTQPTDPTLSELEEVFDHIDAVEAIQSRLVSMDNRVDTVRSKAGLTARPPIDVECDAIAESNTEWLFDELENCSRYNTHQYMKECLVGLKDQLQ